MTRPGTPRSSRPSLRLERELQRAGHQVIAGMDEVGRGALAGPVSVGVVVIDETSPSAPTGVKDSKLLTAAARERMAPRLIRWARAHAVGHAMPGEIDEIGIIAALRLAGTRALADLGLVPDLVLLDGNHDWLTDPEQVGLFAEMTGTATPPVRTMIKGDMRCSSVAAASVLAKVERDGMMAELDREHPHYGWADNKGYSASAHMDALSVHGACDHHRRSWSLPGVGPAVPVVVVDDGADVVTRPVGDLVGEGRPQ
ncbi:ribonuclease HII [Janibacter cremeus]|uniref:Ribonuclease HII n=1 Tax=Janibacter cremeus TaxID=1285192 RepID=A0A852VM50_9MICO|nr:ribonuclease HII [Janibacter cremeus]NYF97186.1 ribonuclease HII [Janibacter cremeus]